MDHTACGKKCPYVKTGFCQDETECPNYVESFWQEGQCGEPKLVRDCVPKRLMIQISQLQARLENVQAASEQNRNAVLVMSEHFAGLVAASRELIEEQGKVKEIDHVVDK